MTSHLQYLDNVEERHQRQRYTADRLAQGAGGAVVASEYGEALKPCGCWRAVRNGKVVRQEWCEEHAPTGSAFDDVEKDHGEQ